MVTSEFLMLLHNITKFLAAEHIDVLPIPSLGLFYLLLKLSEVVIGDIFNLSIDVASSFDPKV